MAERAGDYPPTIDDYTNDLDGRDGLELVPSWASPRLRSRLAPIVEIADRTFRVATVDDDGLAVGEPWRSRPAERWWWTRRPTNGHLADDLDHDR